MKKFRSNIKCSACIEKVTPALNEAVGEGKWKVDTADPSKILTIEGDQTEEQINGALSDKGYKVSAIA